MPMLGLSRGDRVISFGCAEGRLELALARRGVSIIGVDIVRRYIDFANDWADRHRLPARFVYEDMRTCRVPSPGGFDAALYFETLGLIPFDDDVRVLSTLRETVKTGGAIAVDVAEPPTSEETSRSSREMPDGDLILESSFQADRKLQHIDVKFHPKNSDDEIVLRETQTDEWEDHTGIYRHVYSDDDVIAIGERAGIVLRKVESLRSGMRMFLGFKVG